MFDGCMAIVDPKKSWVVRNTCARARLTRAGEVPARRCARFGRRLRLTRAENLVAGVYAAHTTGELNVDGASQAMSLADVQTPTDWKSAGGSLEARTTDRYRHVHSSWGAAVAFVSADASRA